MISIHEQINEAYAYLHGLWRYRWSALLISWLVAVAGWIGVYSLPNKYSAQSIIHIDAASMLQPLLRGLSVETNLADELNMMNQVLLSRENLLSVLEETGLINEHSSLEQREQAFWNMRQAITLNNVGGGRKSRTRTYGIIHTSTSPELSYQVVSSLLNTLIEKTLEAGRTDTVMAEEFLDEQIRDHEARLAQSEARLAEFKKQNVGLMPGEAGDYYNRLQRSKDDIERTRSELRQAKQRYAELRRQLTGESPMLGSSAYSRSTAAKLRSYREQLAELLVRFTEEHPDVQAMRARIADLEAAGVDMAEGGDLPEDDSEAAFNPVYQELKVQESQARIEVSQLQIRLAEKQQKLSELQEAIDVIPQVEADLARLNRDYSVTKDRYLSLVSRRESARMAQKVEESDKDVVLRIVESPMVPILPSGPDRPMLLAGVMVAALGAGFAWCLLLFLLYPTFVDHKQLKKLTGLPVLGAISLQVGPDQHRARRLRLTSFVVSLVLMFGAFGAVLLYQQQGSAQVRALLAGLGY